MDWEVKWKVSESKIIIGQSVKLTLNLFSVEALHIPAVLTSPQSKNKNKKN